MGRAWAVIALGAREGSGVDHGAGKGQGEAWGSLGSQRWEAAAESWRLPAASCSKLEGPVCQPSTQAPAGPDTAVRTEPQFAWPQASPSLVGLGLGFVQPQAQGTHVVPTLCPTVPPCCFLHFSLHCS